jgi:hypothetical protein
LTRIQTYDEAQIQIALFLKSTIKKNAEVKKEKLKNNEDNRFLNSKGEFRAKFKKLHWDMIYQSIPETTILNMLYRLRIKANYYDVETFINADINFKIFHHSLSNIIYYLNYINEGYIHKVIGDVEYKKILDNFPSHLNSETAAARYDRFKM